MSSKISYIDRVSLSYIKQNYIWRKLSATSRSLSRIFCVVFLRSANKNLREIILSLKIFFSRWVQKATTIRIDLWTSQRSHWDQRKTVSRSIRRTWRWRSSSTDIENMQLHHEIDPAHLRSIETSSEGQWLWTMYDFKKKRSYTLFRNVRFVHFSNMFWSSKLSQDLVWLSTHYFQSVIRSWRNIEISDAKDWRKNV